MKNAILKVFGGKEVKRYESANKRRFFNHTRRINWKIGQIKVYLKVIYGKDKDHKGRIQTFYNDGFYTDKAEFTKALNAFFE